MPEGTSTHRDKHLIMSFIVISVTVVLAVTARENEVITPIHTVERSGVPCTINKCFLIGSEH